jgi:hypothetical protein
MSFKVNDKVIFTWNFSQFPCIIEEILYEVEVYNWRIYKVRFPINSYAGSVENPRNILGEFLKLDPNNENPTKIINNQRFEIEI